MTAKEIILKGWYGEKNFGDDLLLSAFISTYKSSQCSQIYLWCKKAKYIPYIVSDCNYFEPWSIKNAESTALLWGGGTQFFTFKGSDKNWKKSNNLLSILMSPSRLFRGPAIATRLLLQKLRNKQAGNASWSGAIGIGVGPFLEDNLEKEENIKKLKSMKWIAVRDQESLNTCVNNGINNAILGADLAYLHPKIGIRASYSGKTIVIPRVTPMDLNLNEWEDEIVTTLSDTANNLIEIISLCKSDHDTAKRIANKLGANITYWNPEEICLDSMIEKISSARVVISARYHGALVSASACVPTIVIGIDQKLQSIATQLPSAVCVSTPEKLIKAYQSIQDLNSSKYQEKNSWALEELQARAWESIRLLKNELENI